MLADLAHPFLFLSSVPLSTRNLCAQAASFRGLPDLLPRAGSGMEFLSDPSDLSVRKVVSEFRAHTLHKATGAALLTGR